MQLIFVYLEKKTNALWKIGYYMCSCSLKTSIQISNSPSHIYQILVPNPKQCTIPTGERRVYLLWKIGYYTCSSPGLRVRERCPQTTIGSYQPVPAVYTGWLNQKGGKPCRFALEKLFSLGKQCDFASSWLTNMKAHSGANLAPSC